MVCWAFHVLPLGSFPLSFKTIRLHLASLYFRSYYSLLV